VGLAGLDGLKRLGLLTRPPAASRIRILHAAMTWCVRLSCGAASGLGTTHVWQRAKVRRRPSGFSGWDASQPSANLCSQLWRGLPGCPRADPPGGRLANRLFHRLGSALFSWRCNLSTTAHPYSAGRRWHAVLFSS